MVTKQTPLPTVQEAVDDLEAAKGHLAEVRAAVVSSATKVGPGDITAAREALEFAELRVELAVDADHLRSDRARLGRIEEIASDLIAGAVHEKGRKVVDLESSWAALLPEHVVLPPISGVEVEGVHVPSNQSGGTGGVVRGAVYLALNRHVGQLNGPLMKLYPLSIHGLSGNLMDEKRTAGEVLAEALDRLNRDAGG